jgi:hypothetical protein
VVHPAWASERCETLAGYRFQRSYFLRTAEGEIPSSKLQIPNKPQIPRPNQPAVVAVSEPVGDLLDGGLFEIVGQGGLAGGGRGAGEDVTAGILNPGNAECRVQSGERRGEGDDAGAAEQINDSLGATASERARE